MDPSGAGTCAQIFRQNVNGKKDDDDDENINHQPASDESSGAKGFVPVDVKISKEQRGWRKLIRNFTPSMSLHKVELSTMTAAWLLPIVAPIVASASGGIVASVLPHPQHALWTILLSYILFGTGFPLAMTILVIYFQRLTVYKIPPREVIVSVFLPLGPLGQGGFALMQLGKVSLTLFPITHTLPSVGAAGASPGPILYTLGFILALVLWGFGLLWLFFALASISRSRFPFNMGWWGFTFPLGVFAVSTVTIGDELPSRFFRVLGTVFSICVTGLWVMVAVGTVKKAIWGGLIFAPCLKDVEGAEREAREHFEEKKGRGRKGKKGEVQGNENGNENRDGDVQRTMQFSQGGSSPV
ncbi:Plasma membrane sulfite pump involved in sulfite metabolism [Ciborinia camelliae]|nr:Plasma membrane sulfite pump involved in sulfite metabolism [Ciborinia camelliae]